ncbi:hypothetical protein NM208_g14957 [Fusarium decemcellulare]|uniref:Uncharacterized protein n=1 Tax=Fusarium decemcellulare TaxID=57161 RepID=A0ACC1REH9_9HYPO|nr:hypothetical protein NM208_g14957 [Fusarium decemcellulare]
MGAAPIGTDPIAPRLLATVAQIPTVGDLEVCLLAHRGMSIDSPLTRTGLGCPKATSLSASINPPESRTTPTTIAAIGMGGARAVAGEDEEEDGDGVENVLEEE